MIESSTGGKSRHVIDPTGRATTFATNKAAMLRRKASHTTVRARRPTLRAEFSNPTVARSKSPSTDNGPSVALTASAPP